ncbi:MAG: alpha/beta fold hydrolase [Bacteroidetes bacterium]|nr:alpha/beta fold hydrolase [Bacteroidota bacterium]
MNTFKLNGISVTDYEGNGEPLIFIHAYPLCSRMWDDQIEFFKNDYRVITYDIRGLGYSNELDSYLFTMEDLADDLENILDHMKIEKVHACGLSVGGYILLRASERFPDRFSSLILADTKADSDDHDGLLNRSASIKKIRSGMKEEFLDAMLQKLISSKSSENTALRKRIREIMSWMDINGLCSVMIAIATRTNFSYRIKDINIPSLIVVGSDDVMTPVINSFYLKEGIKNSVFKTIAGAGHLSSMERPDEFNKIVSEFLKGIKKK